MRIRFQSSRGVLALSLALLTSAGLAACGAQVPDAMDESDKQELRGTQPEKATKHDTSPPLMLLRRAAEDDREEADREAGKEVKPLPRPAHRAGQSKVDRVAQDRFLNLIAAPATLGSFDGISDGFTGPSGTFSVNSAPPDTNGDVGPNHYVQSVNSELAIFSKTGTVLYGPVALNTLWSGFGGG